MEDDRLYRKVSRRIIPLMMILYLLAFFGRLKIGFAALLTPLLGRMLHAPARGHRA